MIDYNKLAGDYIIARRKLWDLAESIAPTLKLENSMQSRQMIMRKGLKLHARANFTVGEQGRVNAAMVVWPHYDEYYHPLYGKTITAGGLVSNFYVPTCVYKTDSEVNSYVY